MIRYIYLIISSAVFLSAALLHAISYTREMPKAYITALSIAAVLLCLPLVALFARLKRERSYQEVWPPFWNEIIERCPRWIWGCISAAWLLFMISFVRSIFTQPSSPLVFQSSAVLIPISAALSYSMTLARK
jgi:membrane protease YdiL (CAAX protease family)